MKQSGYFEPINFSRDHKTAPLHPCSVNMTIEQ